MITELKINGLFYKNFEEIYNALKLEEIKNYEFGFKKYLTLIFTGNIKITTKN